jgi:hypothetical protein
MNEMRYFSVKHSIKSAKEICKIMREIDTAQVFVTGNFKLHIILNTFKSPADQILAGILNAKTFESP